MPALILILTLFVGGTASYAAEGALPGDALYPVKIHVNEEVRGWVAFSPEKEAAWEARRAERRLEEAETLAARGSFNADAHATVFENFGTHADRVEQRVAEFESREELKAAVDVSANFETSLRAHEKILDTLAEKFAEEHDEAEDRIEQLTERVRIKANAAARVRAKAETDASNETPANAQAAATGVMRAAERTINAVHRFVSRVASSLGAEATAKAEARLAAADAAFVGGKQRFDAGAYAEALILFRQAHDIAQEAKLLIEARRNLRIDVKINGETHRNQTDDDDRDERGDEDTGENAEETETDDTPSDKEAGERDDALDDLEDIEEELEGLDRVEVEAELKTEIGL